MKYIKQMSQIKEAPNDAFNRFNHSIIFFKSFLSVFWFLVYGVFGLLFHFLRSLFLEGIQAFSTIYASFIR